MRKLNVSADRVWGRKPSMRQAQVQHLLETVGVVVTRKQVIAELSAMNSTKNDVQWLFNDRRYRAGRGQYSLQPLLIEESTSTTEMSSVAFDA